MKLKNIASIQSGLYQKPDPLGVVLYLQARHFDELGEFDQLAQPECVSGSSIEKHILKNNDILFAAKGAKNFAAVYRQEAGEAVASSSLFVIRIHKTMLSVVLPEFLQWYLNSIDGQNFIKFHVKGTAIQSIPISVLGDMEFTIPRIEQQEKIIKVQALRLREKYLLTEIERLKDQFIQRQLLSFTK
jgi:restriction endonuclease S subunit